MTVDNLLVILQKIIDISFKKQQTIYICINVSVGIYYWLFTGKSFS